MKLASDIAATDNRVTYVTWPGAMLVLKGRHHSRATAGFAEF